jgi:hypothetical protein
MHSGCHAAARGHSLKEPMTRFVTATIALLLSIVPAGAADDLVQRLATCQDSWLDMKSDPDKIKQFAESFNAGFEQKPNSPSFVPKTRLLVAGLPVTEAFPESVGMGVGFSVVVDGTFEKAKAALEKTTGQSLKQCETGDGMRTCALELAERRTLMIMADSAGKSTTTLLGCYYYYEK